MVYTGIKTAYISDIRMRIHLLNVPIDAVTRAEARTAVTALLHAGKGSLVTTPNPEMLVQAQRQPAFLKTLQSAALALPDGIGLVWVARLKGHRIPERITGTDFVGDVAQLAAMQGKRVFFLGGRGDAAARAAAMLQRWYPTLNVVGAESGGDVTRDASGTPLVATEVEDRIRAAAPDILFVAFGHGTQERWIEDALPRLPSVRVAMGIGGAFDFIAGDVLRAPATFRALGLEWLWRLFLQPWRWKRIWTAVVVFPILAFRSKN